MNSATQSSTEKNLVLNLEDTTKPTYPMHTIGRQSLVSRAIKSGSLIAALFITAAAAHAQVIFNIGYSFNGPNPPGATLPWVVAKFEDYASDTNKVLLTLTAPGLVGDQKANNWWFNADPTVFDNGTLTSSPTSGVTIGENSNKADGGGDYDIHIELAADLNVGDSAQFLFSWTGPSGALNLNPTHFGPGFFSEPDGGEGVWPVAVHITGYEKINGDDSNFATVAVPEPGAFTAVLGALALVSATCHRMIRRRSLQAG